MDVGDVYKKVRDWSVLHIPSQQSRIVPNNWKERDYRKCSYVTKDRSFSRICEHALLLFVVVLLASLCVKKKKKKKNSKKTKNKMQ